MAATRVGLDIGSTAVRIAAVTEEAKPKIVRLGQVPLGAGAVEAGEVRQPDTVREAVRAAAKAAGIEPGPTALAIASPRVVVRDISIPWLPSDDLRQALAFQVQDYVPTASADTIVDYIPLSERSIEGQRMQQLLLIAAPRSDVLAHVDAVEGAGFVPESVDLGAFAAVRALWSGDPSEAAAVVDIGGHLTSISLHRGGAVRLVRILQTGGRVVTSAIRDALGDADVATSELLKRGEAAEGFDLAGARAAARAAIAPLVDEVVSTIEFSGRNEPDLRIGRVLLTGGGANLDGLAELIGARTEVPVERASLFRRAKSGLPKRVEAAADASGGFAVAVGLAIADQTSASGRAA